ncbi:MAG: amidohydrolase family protein [Alphaproteobacteria bacterium]|nr:amidohydrolase family protein [Alphaproteobacteria bacterium SS10]
MQTLYSGGLLFDGDGRLLENYGVLVENDRVIKIAPRPEFTGFAGYVVDTSGGTLMPALIDGACHIALGAEADPVGALGGRDESETTLMALEHLQASLVGGFGVVRDLGGAPDVARSLADAMQAGRFMGASLLTAGCTIVPTGGHGEEMGVVADGSLEVMQSIRALAASGAHGIVFSASGGVTSADTNPSMTYMTAEELEAGVVEAHRLGRPTAVMAHNTDAAKLATQAQAGAVLYGAGLDDDTIGAMVAGQVYLVPALGASRALADAADDAGLDPAIVDTAKQLVDAHAGALKRFYDAGGKVAFGSDSGMPLLAHGENALELRHLVASGMTPIDALIAATGYAADMLGLVGRGRVAEGGVADLLVVDGNPADNIDAVAERGNHRLVVSGGTVAARRN